MSLKYHLGFCSSRSSWALTFGFFPIILYILFNIFINDPDKGILGTNTQNVPVPAAPNPPAEKTFFSKCQGRKKKIIPKKFSYQIFSSDGKKMLLMESCCSLRNGGFLKGMSVLKIL